MQEKAAGQKQEAKHYVNKNRNYLKQLLAQIESVSNQLTKIAVEIDQTEENLHETAQKLETTKARIKERSHLLDTRVRLMYTDGAVSYLDVLLSSTSFTDF